MNVILSNFERIPKFDLGYRSAIYSGISRAIEFEIKHGWGDMREELAYMVDRYREEESVSGIYLKEELSKYNKIAQEKYGDLIKN